MELELAKKLLDMEEIKLSMLLEKFSREEKDAYEILKELIEDEL